MNPSVHNAMTAYQIAAEKNKRIAELEAENQRYREALEAARMFIRNGIDLEFIRMPDPDTPDPAHNTLPLIEKALEAGE
jgi:hypothetical protein